MKPRRARIFWAAAVAMLRVMIGGASIGSLTHAAEEDRIWLDSSINGKLAHLYFDTGACGLNLLSSGASRLGLKFTPPPLEPPGPIFVRRTKTDECDFRCGNFQIKTAFLVAAVPSLLGPSEDGSVGWLSELFTGKIVQVDARRGTLIFISRPPDDISRWNKWRIRTNACIVSLEFPGNERHASFINIDTGSPSGVMLSPDRWQRWQAANPNRARTLNAYYQKVAGLVVAEEAWAGALELGPLVLHNVPVMEANNADLAMSGDGFAATVGLAVLRQLDLILDAKSMFAYSRTNRAPFIPYVHNCLGAVFVPEDLQSLAGENLVARVAPGTPASKAGIRDGDILLKWNDVDTAPWRTQPNVRPSFRYSSNQPPAQLTLRRGTNTFSVQVEPAPILAPGTEH